jgi:hypothetical protein
LGYFTDWRRLAFDGGDRYCPVFLGYLDAYSGEGGIVHSTFSCLGYSVPFTYTRGGNYCNISISDTASLIFYIKAAIASVQRTGVALDESAGHHRGTGTWWLHCWPSSSNSVVVQGFHQTNKHNDSWWGGNPLYAGADAASIITVCLFGYVVFR